MGIGELFANKQPPKAEKPTFRKAVQTAGELKPTPKSGTEPSQAADAHSSAVTATPLGRGEKGVQKGEELSQQTAAVAHGVGDSTKPREAAPEFERIPSTLSAPVRALAQRVLAPDEVWTGTSKAISIDMRTAISALSEAEGRVRDFGSSRLPEQVRVGVADLPVWEYIGHCVDAIGAGTIKDISTTLDTLLADPHLAPLVPRIVALHAAQVFLGHPDIKNASRNTMSVPTMNLDYYMRSEPQFIAKLQAVAQYVQQHPDSGSLVKAFFGYQTPLLNTLNPAHMILKYCGIT